jgi:hypothetical protein
VTNPYHYNNGGKKLGDIEEKAYIASGDWKCATSPTGGHWWNCNVRPSVCKFCGKVKSHSHK